MEVTMAFVSSVRSGWPRLRVARIAAGEMRMRNILAILEGERGCREGRGKKSM